MWFAIIIIGSRKKVGLNQEGGTSEKFWNIFHVNDKNYKLAMNL